MKNPYNIIMDISHVINMKTTIHIYGYYALKITSSNLKFKSIKCILYFVILWLHFEFILLLYLYKNKNINEKNSIINTGMNFIKIFERHIRNYFEDGFYINFRKLLFHFS